MKNDRIKEYKEACIFLKEYINKKSEYAIIHFARENHFEELLPKGPTIVAIAIFYPSSDSISVHSLHRSAETMKKEYNECSKDEKDEIEKRMLENFFDEVKSQKNKTWLHWNMKNHNFGFQTLEDRFVALGGKMENDMKFDSSKTKNLATVFKRKYGPNYINSISETKGKLYFLMERNSISDPDLLTGREEVRAFIEGNIVRIELSVIAKVKVFERLLDYARNGELKTDCRKWKDIYGLSIEGLAEYIQDNALLAIISSILTGIITTVVCKLLGM